jgi:hypothetical protein
VREDFTIFWTNEDDPAAKRQFLALVFEGVRLDAGRVVAVRREPSFLPLFEKQREESAGRARVSTGATGLEPATSAVTGQRSNLLSYAPAIARDPGDEVPRSTSMPRLGRRALLRAKLAGRPAFD